MTRSVRVRAVRLAPVVLALTIAPACDDGGGLDPPGDIGPDPVTVTPFIATSLNEFAGAWSPDGTHIAFCRGNEGVDLHIYVHEVATGSEQQVTDLPAARECFPDWSPDGLHLVYDNAQDIFITPATGDSTTLFTGGAGQELFAAWSPDSTWIAFSAQLEIGNVLEFDLLLASVTRDSVIQITGSVVDEAEPAWSPDGERLAFRSGPPGGIVNIWIYDLSDSTFTQITSHDALDTNPDFSPDGRYLAWASLRSGNAEIWAIDLETPGAIPVQLTSHQAIDNTPAWAPDGESILFSTRREGNWDLYMATGLDSMLAISTAGEEP